MTRTALLALLGQRGPMSRAALARELDVSSPTVGLVAKAPVERGLVTELDRGPSTGGRPGQLLSLAGRAGRAVGVKVSLDRLAAADMRLEGEVIRSQVDGFDARAPGGCSPMIRFVPDNDVSTVSTLSTVSASKVGCSRGRKCR